MSGDCTLAVFWELLCCSEGEVPRPRDGREECGWSQAGEESIPLTQSEDTRSGPTEIAVAARWDRGGEGINRCAGPKIT